MNVSSLADGTLTFSVTLTDEAGNTGAAATATATLDTAVPRVYDQADRALSTPARPRRAGFTFAGPTTARPTTTRHQQRRHAR